MNILILNGSPAGKDSITLYTMLFIQKHFPGHHYEILHVGQQIKKLSGVKIRISADGTNAAVKVKRKLTGSVNRRTMPRIRSTVTTSFFPQYWEQSMDTPEPSPKKIIIKILE